MFWAAACLGLIAAGGLVLWLMGRVPICACGYVSLWHGDPWSSGNSQHLTDWYTPSHVIHGFLFYAALAWAMPRASLGLRAAIATALEMAWEIAENTDAVINRYREVTVSLDYFGDSVVNSVMDGAAMLLGFALARVLPVWLSVLLCAVMELVVLAVIRDNLALNVLMLVWPLESVRSWQAGAQGG
ncbi:MAG TPA: DUF2585 domain-containing protein [Acetobacteraceae bacterium]|nr:DUF2585 domain-containing protein [Acetobacteraceae bacterium]